VLIGDGKLRASLYFKIIGTLFPGNKIIYLKQSLIFLKTMFLNTNFIAAFTFKIQKKIKTKQLLKPLKEKRRGSYYLYKLRRYVYELSIN